MNVVSIVIDAIIDTLIPCLLKILGSNCLFTGSDPLKLKNALPCGVALTQSIACDLNAQILALFRWLKKKGESTYTTLLGSSSLHNLVTNDATVRAANTTSSWRVMFRMGFLLSSGCCWPFTSSSSLVDIVVTWYWKQVRVIFVITWMRSYSKSN